MIFSLAFGVLKEKWYKKSPTLNIKPLYARQGWGATHVEGPLSTIKSSAH